MIRELLFLFFFSNFDYLLLLFSQGPQVMKGYYRNDKATAETIDQDGWLHTGDVAVCDEEDMFYIVDR